MAAPSAVIDRLLRRLAAIGPDELPSAVKEDMIYLKKALSRWHVVLESTEKQFLEGVSGEYSQRSKVLMSKENKMRKIKQIAYHIEDILDEFEGCGRSGSGANSARSEEVFCCSSGPSFLPSTMVSRMKMLRKKLDRESEKSIIFQLLHHSKPDLVTSDGHGSSDLSSIIGRENDRASIKIIINKAGPFSIIPIVGLSGIGKTALAKSIFNDRGEDCKFDHHIWINLNMSFDLCYVVNGIISQAGNKEEVPSQKNKWTQRNLLQEVLTDKRTLVVLDDLWSMDRNQLDELKEMMSTVICSVIVTTSSEEVAKLFNTVLPYKLGLLSDSDCWTIFSGVASADQEIRDHVVRLCQGMPIVVHSLSSVVHAKGKNVLKDANNKELWHLEKQLLLKVKMFQPLKKNYYKMPSGLKLCLGYLSIFPKGFHMDTEKLIWQWSALDMLGSSHGILSPYVQGKNYIQSLLSIFFLQARDPCSANGMVLTNGKNGLEMHSLVHSFARYLSCDELIILEDQIAPVRNKKKVTFRYALLLKCNEASTISKGFLTRARAISFKGCKGRKLLEEALSALRHLNVLDLSGCSFLELPSSVGQLKHLRYLDISHSAVQSLPSEMRSLQNLEALDLSKTSVSVPLDPIGPFQKLKYLNMQECPNLRDLLQTFGDLKRLEHLNLSRCSDVSELPETLCGFSALQLLDLSSCAELEKLPQSFGSLNNLGDLNLSGCSRLEQLPESFHELYSLKFLNLESCSMLQQLPHLFGNLKTLEVLNLAGCISLQELPKSFGDLYFLQVLNLEGCFGLQESPKFLGNLLNLENLNLSHISLELPEALINLRKLHTLDLTGCGFKKSFADIVNKMTNLKFVFTDDSRLALSFSRHIIVSTDNNKQSCLARHIVQSSGLERDGIMGETDAEEIFETPETIKGTTDRANLQQEPSNPLQLIAMEDKASSADVFGYISEIVECPTGIFSKSGGKDGSRLSGCSSRASSASMSPSAKTECEIMRSANVKIFTFNDLKAATRNFSPDSVLGEGGFGYVYKGWIDENTLSPCRSGTGIAVSVKRFNHEDLQGQREWLVEVNYLGQLSHPNLIKLIGYCLEDEHRLLVYEFMPRGSLEHHLFRRGSYFEPLSWNLRMKVALGAAKGLAYLHSVAKVIYRNFKTSNILLDTDYTAKLSDFGLAKDGPVGEKSHVSTRVMGTFGYSAPEYLARGHLTAKSDIYSFGVVLLEMLSGLRVIDMNRPQDQYNLVQWVRPYLTQKRKIFRILDTRLEGQYSLNGAQTIAALAFQCLFYEAKKRPTMDAVVAILEELQGAKGPLAEKHQEPKAGTEQVPAAVSGSKSSRKPR